MGFFLLNFSALGATLDWLGKQGRKMNLFLLDGLVEDSHQGTNKSPSTGDVNLPIFRTAIKSVYPGRFSDPSLLSNRVSNALQGEVDGSFLPTAVSGPVRRVALSLLIVFSVEQVADTRHLRLKRRMAEARVSIMILHWWRADPDSLRGGADKQPDSALWLTLLRTDSQLHQLWTALCSVGFRSRVLR